MWTGVRLGSGLGNGLGREGWVVDSVIFLLNDDEDWRGEKPCIPSPRSGSRGTYLPTYLSVSVTGHSRRDGCVALRYLTP